MVTVTQEYQELNSQKKNVMYVVWSTEALGASDRLIDLHYHVLLFTLNGACTKTDDDP